MIEQPNVPDGVIIDGLQQHYSLIVKQLEFLPIGNDASAWVYKVSTTDGAAYFLKLKRGKVSAVTLSVTRYLYDSGLKQVVAPLPTCTQSLYALLEDYAFILYPYIGDENGMDKGLSPEQWGEYGRILKRLHTFELTAELAPYLPYETFVVNPKWIAIIQALQAAIEDTTYQHPAEKELAVFWQAQQETISRVCNRTLELGKLLQSNTLPFVVCHGDIHTANILLDAAGKLFVVDWDQTIIAPKERDLMFVVEDSISPENQQAFFAGYGQVEIDWLALAYYRYEWVVQEFADYGERVFLMPDMGEIAKADAVRGFKQLFLEGDVIDVAYACEAYLK